MVLGLRLATIVATSAVVASAAVAASLPDTIDRIRHSIVAVGTTEPTRNPPFQFRGTGFVVGDGTWIATNDHVLPADTDATKREVISIAIPQANGESIVREARIAIRDQAHDVAILKITVTLPPMRFGDSTKVREGERFAFTGFPIGNVIGLFPTTHQATLSAITPIVLTPASARSLDPALIRKLRAERFAIFQLDATAYPGNSGSPLFDTETGEVVGVINSVFVKGGKESVLSQPSGISYAIPAIHFSKAMAEAAAATTR